jgi:hypothetical protein
MDPIARLARNFLYWLDWEVTATWGLILVVMLIICLLPG